MKVLVVSPYHGRSSHAAWAEGYQASSSHEVALLSLDDRNWAWRMRGGSVGLSGALTAEIEDSDILMATSMTDLAGFLGLIRRSPLATKPVIFYVHENQLTYPIRKQGVRDRGLPWIQFTSMLAADHVWFNSEHNRSSWFAALPEFLAGFPDHQGADQVESMMAKSRVVPVGLSLPRPDQPLLRPTGGPPLLLWNQRWDWDKNPEAFCDLVKGLLGKVEFEVVMLGQTPQREPPNLTEVKAILGHRLLHAGWCSRQEYTAWLARADLTVSTARHEFFGIALLEAAAHGVFPLLPRKLAYPELLPPEEFPDCFYLHREELLSRALEVLANPASVAPRAQALKEAAYRYSWEALAPRYDAEMAAVSEGSGAAITT